MDWSKAKTIIIGALILANLFLLTVLLVGRSGGLLRDQDLAKNTALLLARKGIQMEQPFPKFEAELPVLKVETKRLDLKEKTDSLKNTPTLPPAERTRIHYIQLTENFLKTCAERLETAVLDRVEETSGEIDVFYKNVYNDRQIVDSFIHFTIRDGRIVAFDRFWLEPLEYGRTKKAVLSPAEALIELMNQYTPQTPVVVRDMELVYWLDQKTVREENTLTDTAFPAWRIRFTDGQIRYIPAYRKPEG